MKNAVRSLACMGVCLMMAWTVLATQVEGEDYSRLQYLEANGNVSVDTGITARRDVAIEAEIACTPATTTSLNYMGAVYGESKGWIAIGDYGEGKLVSYFANGSRVGAGVTQTYDSLFHYYFCGDGCQVIDTTTNTTTVVDEMGLSANPLNISVFGAAIGWAGTPAAKSKVRYFNVYKSGSPVRRLIPVVRNSDGALCFYDLQTDAYFTKSGTGSLIAGPLVEADKHSISVGSEWYYEGTITGSESGLHDEGETLTFAAVPKAGYRFRDWTGDLAAVTTVESNRLTIVVGKSTPLLVSVQARFERLPRPHVFSMSVKATSFAEGGDLVTPARRTWLADWFRTNGFTKVWLESYRHNVYAPTDVLTAARDEFRAAGYEVCGLITPTCLHLDPSETPSSGQYATCFSNPAARNRLTNEVTRCARLFDTILFDDFLYADCPASCPYCGSATEAFRLNLINTVCREIVAAARAANPNCRCIIKYPCWYQNWAAKGLVPAEQTAIFGECWVGSETRDAGADAYWAYRAWGYADGLCNGRCGGVWFDPLDSKPAKFVEQAYYSILCGAPETLVHCYDYMLGDNGGTTPFGESFEGAHECGRLLMARMDELHRLADFCDAATRGTANLKSSGVSVHLYVLSNENYIARLNTKTKTVDDDLGPAAPNEFVFPKRESEWSSGVRIPGAEYLPGGYLRLDYIYSSVGQTAGFTDSPEHFIDTGYTPTNTAFGFYFDFRYDGALASSAPRIMGSSVRDNEKGAYWCGVSLGGYSFADNCGEFLAFANALDRYAVGTVTYPVVDVNPLLSTGWRRELEMRNRLVYIPDGRIYDLRKYDDVSYFNGSLWIGNMHAPDYLEKIGSAPIRVYRFKIYEGDRVVHDFVPVRSSSGIVGLYDLVGDKGFRPGPGFASGPWIPARFSARLDYIESDGNSFFDLGVVVATNVAIEAEMACVGATSERAIMGAIYGASKGWITIGDYGEGNLVSYFATSSRAGAGVTIPYDTAFHRYYCGDGRQSIDGVSNTTRCAQEMPETINLSAFKASTSYDETIQSRLKVRYIKVYRSGKLIHWLLPYDASGKICMYDRIGKKFFFNEGTGDFTAGPQISGLTMSIR